MTTTMPPPNGRWRAVTRLTIDDQDHERVFGNHRDAYLFARRFACCRGGVYARVHAPDGALAHEWKRDDNQWIAHVPHPEV